MRLELPRLDPVRRACLHFATGFVRGTDDVQVYPSGTALNAGGMHQRPSPLILMLAEAARRAFHGGASDEVFRECVKELHARQVSKKEIKWLGWLHDELLSGMDELRALADRYALEDSDSDEPPSTPRPGFT
jgi:hypothetical protein